MLYMSEYDLTGAKAWAEADEMHLTIEAIGVLERLIEWTNDNSDGWAYWPKPATAARRLMELIQAQEKRARSSAPSFDMDTRERDVALRTIRSFLTRQGVTPGMKRWIIEGKRA